MARGRILSKEIAADAALNRLSPDAERLYLRTLPHLDRDGLITGVPALVWATAAPLRLELMDKTPTLIDEWVAQGLVTRYDGSDGPVLFFRGFRKHQANMPYGSEQASKYPPPPGWYRTQQGLVPEDPDLVRTLADGFDARSKYRAALLGAAKGSGNRGQKPVATRSRPHRDQVASKSEPGSDEDQDQHQVKDQDQQFDDDGTSPFLSADDGEEIELLRSWCKDVAADQMPEWIGSAERIQAADLRQLVVLSTWLYAYGQVRPRANRYAVWGDDYRQSDQFLLRHRDLFRGVENVVGRVITQALQQGNPYPLDEDARQALKREIALYGDGAEILFGHDNEEGKN